MELFEMDKDSYITINRDNQSFEVIKKDIWNKYNSDILGLGNIATKSTIRSVICAIFDLEGFTNFCKQIDPHLAVPMFLSKYLEWFFDEIKTETKKEEYDEGIDTWHELPFLIKFMGDGLLVLWDISKIDEHGQVNIIISCNQIVDDYINNFLPVINKKVVEPPGKLRCGIAKGNVFSIGNGLDYVGPCINFASRLQKLPGVSFAFSNRGIDLEAVDNKYINEDFIEKLIEVKGIGNSEIVFILEREYENMDESLKEIYKNV
jgi:hypothetical protein